MVLLSIFFTNQIHGGIISRLFFIHFCRSMRLLFIWQLKYYLNLSYEDLSTYAHTSVGCISQEIPSRTALCYAANTVVKTFLIFDINHQQNTKEVRQIETIKTIMQTTRPRITWKVLPMAQVAVLKKYSIKCRKDLDCIDCFILN